MAFKNRRFAKKIALKPCEWCGWKGAGRDAAHIIDEVKGANEWNAISFCPNCHRIFEDILRPKLYKALEKFGATQLPKSWSKSNKLSGEIL